MQPYLTSVEATILEGAFQVSLQFQKGLNIICGENGTGKTQLLRAIKGQQLPPHMMNTAPQVHLTAQGQPRFLAFSPIRHSHRKALDTIMQEVRSQNKDLPRYVQQRLASALQDSTFEDYASFGELFVYVYDETLKVGSTNPIDVMNRVKEQFDDEIRAIFEDYSLVAQWVPKIGPRVQMRKRGTVINLESLSLGEQEVLSLALNIHAQRDSFDVALIDEPEVHLNWNLEEKLFDSFDRFCNRFDKQLIVATHSRAAFADRFLPKTTFLFWEGDHIKSDKSIPDNLRRRIAGEAINYIKFASNPQPVFFVEDRAQQEVIEGLARALECQVQSMICGNRSVVESLYRYSKTQQMENCYFVRDGDNENNPFPNESNFIHLLKYCIENFLLDVDIAASVSGKSPADVKRSILVSIQDRRQGISKSNKFFELLLQRLQIDDITDDALATLDASKFLAALLNSIGIDRPTYIDRYTDLCKQQGKLTSVFPTQLIEAIQT